MKQWHVIPAVLVLSAFGPWASGTLAQAQTTLRDSAFAVADAGRSLDAQPLFERLIASSPDDIGAHERFGLLLFTNASALPDAEARRLQRVRARAMLEKALKLGSKNGQIAGMFGAIPPDGGTDGPSYGSKDLDEAMRLAEVAYANGRHREALSYYQKALSLDPKLYVAAVYSGDAYSHIPLIDSAYVWYERATVIDPNKEMAWRYWGDIMTKNGRVADARDKIIEALVVDPYSRFTRAALTTWAGVAKARVGFPALDINTGTAEKPAGVPRVAYDSVRLAWRGADGKGSELFRTAYPSESQYRHSVAEERAALRAAYRVSLPDSRNQILKAMDDEGLLDAFIFIVGGDQGIAREYDQYLREFRAELRAFWKKYAIAPTPAN
jgi:tetratricopeptide (TPR) repeat protein